MNSEIVLMDEKGNDVIFELIATFGMDDRNFCALSEDGEAIMFFEMLETEEGIDFLGIEDYEMEDVIETFESLQDEKE